MRANLAGYKWLWYDGYGRYCLKTTQALLRNGHDIYPFDIQLFKNKPAWFFRAQGLNFDRVTIQLMPPDMTKPLPGRSIIYTMHESKTVPYTWPAKINAHAQFLMVPSPWLVEVFKEGGVQIPIAVVPSGIDPDECPVFMRRSDHPYTFGCLADRGSRKGHQIVYSAFWKAFGHQNKDVRLIMKCRPGSLSQLDLSYSSDPRLSIWRADVPDVADIYNQFDAFIFPTKCEGWGQPPREAAACGLPVVVTRWSGTDDETDKWAIPLDKFSFVESGMIGCGGEWANPDEDEVVHWMRWLYEHQDEGRRKGLEAAKWLRLNRTYAQAAEALVKQVGEWLGDPHPEPPIPEDEQRQLRELTLLSLARLEEEPETITGDEPEPVKIRSNGHRAVKVRA